MSQQDELIEVVNVQITNESAVITREGFGTALLAAEGFTETTGDVVKAYGSLAEVLADDFAATGPVYQAAAAYFGQQLHPRRLYIGELDTDDVVGSLNAIRQVNDDWYALMVIDEHGDVTLEDESVVSREDRLLLIAEWIEPQDKLFVVTAYGSDVTESAVGDDTVSFPARLRTDGYSQSASLWSGESNGLEAGLALQNGEFDDPIDTGANNWETWSGAPSVADGQLTLTSDAPTEQILFQRTGLTEAGSEITIDVDSVDSGSGIYVTVGRWVSSPTDIEIVHLEGLITTTGTHAFTPGEAWDVIVVFLASDPGAHSVVVNSITVADPVVSVPALSAVPAAAYLGRMLPTTPGSETWAHKRLSGVTPADLSAEQRINLFAKNVNLYSTISGIAAARYGTTATGEFIDVVRGIHCLKQRIREDVFRLFAAQPKVPFTDAGIGAVESVLRKRLELAQQDGLIAPDTFAADGVTRIPGFTVTVPRANEVAVANRADRLLPDVEFSARLAGAVHRTEINGRVSV